MIYLIILSGAVAVWFLNFIIGVYLRYTYDERMDKWMREKFYFEGYPHEEAETKLLEFKEKEPRDYFKTAFMKR